MLEKEWQFCGGYKKNRANTASSEAL